MKHAAPADQTPAPASSPETTARRRFSAPKIIGIVAGSIVGLLLIAYVAGSLYFTDRFMPNTVLGDHDVSLKTSSEVQAILDDALSDYTVAVSGQGFSMKLSAKDAGVSFDGQAIVADALGNTNPWLWPLEITPTSPARLRRCTRCRWFCRGCPLRRRFRSPRLPSRVRAALRRRSASRTGRPPR